MVYYREDTIGCKLLSRNDTVGFVTELRVPQETEMTTVMFELDVFAVLGNYGTNEDLYRSIAGS